MVKIKTHLSGFQWNRTTSDSGGYTSPVNAVVIHDITRNFINPLINIDSGSENRIGEQSHFFQSKETQESVGISHIKKNIFANSNFNNTSDIPEFQQGIGTRGFKSLYPETRYSFGLKHSGNNDDGSEISQLATPKLNQSAVSNHLQISLEANSNKAVPTLTTIPTLTFTELNTPQSLNANNSDAEAADLIRLEQFYSGSIFSGIDGRGSSVVVLDTGIDLDHPFFGTTVQRDINENKTIETFEQNVSNRIVFATDFSGSNDNNASDTNGHGTHVSSIVARTARGVNIIHLKVFPDGANPRYNGADIEEALQWVINNRQRFNIVSVNMSLGSGNLNTATTDSQIGDELKTLVDNGVIPVTAAGNSFAVFKSVQGVNIYSADPNTLSVGAVYDANVGGVQMYDIDGNGTSETVDNTTAADRITSFSQRGALLDIFAPGASITAAKNGGGSIDMSGTSMAAPHIAGIVALAQQLSEKALARRLTFQEFGDLLRTTGVTIGILFDF